MKRVLATAMRTKIAAALAVLLAGCVVAHSTMLDDHRAIISGRGNAFVSSADVMQRTLNEAAKTTLQHGYRYFTIMASQDQSRAGVFVVPGQTYSNGTVTAWGNTATYSESTYTTPGTVSPFVKPGVDVVIYMYRDGEVLAGPNIWDARSVLSATEPPAAAATNTAPVPTAPTNGAATTTPDTATAAPSIIPPLAVATTNPATAGSPSSVATASVASGTSTAPKKYCLLPSGEIMVVTEKDCTQQGGRFSF